MSPRTTRAHLRALVALAVVAALASARTPVHAAAARSAAPARPNAAHLISHSKEAVPFVADDYARALAAARAKRVPIFVETWAPW